MAAPEPPSHLDLQRPAPPRSTLHELTERVRWFGFARLVVSAVSVALVVGGAWWLLRAPSPDAETALPLAPGATAAGATSGAAPTLPAPTTVPAAATSAPAATLPSSIVVHVAGAVVAPGVHEVPGGARVADAVVAAGGVAPGGDADGVNLAAPLSDGQRVYVPRLGEVDPAAVPSGAVPAEAPAGSSAPSGPLDLNTATVADLERLPGVGPATAASIVDDRTRNGPFASVDDLDRVSGIGPAKLAALRDLVTV